VNTASIDLSAGVDRYDILVEWIFFEAIRKAEFDR
jgi:hypothetical protein